MKRKSTKRSNGEGTIIYESDRQKYRAFLTDPLGKRISKRFNSNAEALQWLAETRADIYRDEYVPTNDITLGEWLLEYIETYRKSKVRNTTYEGYLYISQYIAPVADYTLQDINEVIMQRFFNNLKLSSASKHTIKRLLNHCLNKAVELQIIKTSPLKGVELPKLPKNNVDVFTQDEVNIILNTIKNHKIYSKYHTFVALAFATGMRIGELCGLKIKNVHNDYVYVDSTIKRIGKTMVDNKPKTESSQRKISIPRELCEALRKEHNGDETEYVFHTSALQPQDYSNVRSRWEKILKLCNIPFKNFHVIRHTHATLLIYAGVPITEIARRLGHSKISTTLNVYSHYINNYDNGIADTVGAMFDLKNDDCTHVAPVFPKLCCVFMYLLSKN